MTDIGHLRSFVERIENLETEIKERNSDKRDIYKEAKDASFDVQAIKDTVAFRRDPKKASLRSDHCDEYLALLSQGPSNNAPARNSGPTEGHLTKPSRAPARELEPSGDAGHVSRSAPAVATGGGASRGRGPATTTNSDALAVQPSPIRNDSSAAAGMAPSVPAAPIRESDEFNRIPEFLMR